MNSSHTKTKIVRHFGIFVAALSLFFVSASFVYGQVMRDRLLPGTRIGGIDVGGFTITEAVEKLRAAVATYETNAVRFHIGDETVIRSLSELGISLSIGETVAAAYAQGRTSAFALPAFAITYDVPFLLDVDEPAQRAFLASFEAEYSLPARDASLATIDGEVTVQPSRAGRTVLPPSLAHIGTTLSFLKPVDISVVVRDVQPDLSESQVRDVQPQFADALAHPVTVTTFGGSLMLSADMLRQWLTVHEVNGNAEIGFAEGFAETVFVPLEQLVTVASKTSFDFVSENRGEYALKNAEGRELDLAETTRRVLSVLDDPAPRAVEVAVRTVPPVTTLESVTAPKETGKAIVVDLGRQTVFAFENGALKFWTRTSTGKGAFKTPTGEWKVYGKTRRQVMSGPGYYLPNVQWVLPYDGDYTLHGTYWHTDFGNPRSHGCSNLSNTDAEWIYTWADIGTPVIVTDHLS